MFADTPLFTWILILGCVWIVVMLMWRRSAAEDGFQVWSNSIADSKARKNHSCGVLDRFPDRGGPQGAFVEIVDDTCEDGLPHTSDADTIRIPRTMWDTATPNNRETTLRHERIHIDQRRRPAAWSAFYRDAWGYTVSATPPASLPADVLAAVRGNPDTWPAPWAIWRSRYCFVPLYTDLHAPRLRDAEPRVWDLQTASWVARPPEWEAFFCQGVGGRCVHQSEHPAEIAAEMGASLDVWGASTAAGISLQKMLTSKEFANLPAK